MTLYALIINGTTVEHEKTFFSGYVTLQNYDISEASEPPSFISPSRGKTFSLGRKLENRCLEHYRVVLKILDLSFYRF